MGDWLRCGVGVDVFVYLGTCPVGTKRGGCGGTPKSLGDFRKGTQLLAYHSSLTATCVTTTREDEYQTTRRYFCLPVILRKYTKRVSIFHAFNFFFLWINHILSVLHCSSIPSHRLLSAGLRPKIHQNIRTNHPHLSNIDQIHPTHAIICSHLIKPISYILHPHTIKKPPCCRDT